MKTVMTADKVGLTPTELIRKLVTDSRPEGGSVFLDDFCAQLPNTPRADCVAAVKNSKDVLFVVGRKGHASRIVFGRLKDNYWQAPSFKSPLASGPIRHHAAQRHQIRKPQQSHSVVAEGTELDASKFRLRVVVQGQEVFVPIDGLELVPVS